LLPCPPPSFPIITAPVGMEVCYQSHQVRVNGSPMKQKEMERERERWVVPLHNPRGCQAPVPMGNPRNSRKGDAYAAATPSQRRESSCCCCFLHGYPSRNCDTASHSLPYIETPQVEGCKRHREGFFDDDARARLHHARDGHITNTDAPSLHYNILSLDSLHKNHKLKNLLPLFSSSPFQQLVPKNTRTYILLSFSLPLPSPPYSLNSWLSHWDIYLLESFWNWDLEFCS
jgi:hypothetical protein